MQRYRVGNGIVLGFLWIFLAAGSPASPFAWLPDLDTAREESRRTGKPVLLVLDVPEERWVHHIEDVVVPGSSLAQAANGFVWVRPGTELRQTLLERFHVKGFPSILLLGPADENIHRMSGYLSADQVSTFLAEAQPRYELFRNGLDWDPPPARSDTLTSKYKFRTLPAPSDGMSDGLAATGGVLFVKQGPRVYRADESTGEVRGSFPLRGNVGDLSCDGGFLYAIDYCWTSGQPIYVVDPEDGEIVRSIVTRANLGRKDCATSGIEVHDGKIWVLELTGKLHEIDPATGDVVRTTPTQETFLHGLEWDGGRFVTLGSSGIVFLDPSNGRIDRVVPMNYTLRSIGYDAGRFFLMEQPVTGNDRNHDPVRLSPKAFVIYTGSLGP